MWYPIVYKRISPGLYSVYLSGNFIGEVRLVNDSWFFRSFESPAFVSFVPAPTRYYAVVQWPGFHSLIK